MHIYAYTCSVYALPYPLLTHFYTRIPVASMLNISNLRQELLMILVTLPQLLQSSDSMYLLMNSRACHNSTSEDFYRRHSLRAFTLSTCDAVHLNNADDHLLLQPHI